MTSWHCTLLVENLCVLTAGPDTARNNIRPEVRAPAITKRDGLRTTQQHLVMELHVRKAEARLDRPSTDSAKRQDEAHEPGLTCHLLAT